jgi:hypothetical protein
VSELLSMLRKKARTDTRDTVDFEEVVMLKT